MANLNAAKSDRLQRKLQEIEQQLLQEQMKQVFVARHDLLELQQERASQSQALGEAISLLNKAQVLAPDHPPVRAVMAEFWAQRVVELERAGDAPAAMDAAAQGMHLINTVNTAWFSMAYPLSLAITTRCDCSEFKPKNSGRAAGNIIVLNTGEPGNTPW